MTAVCCVGAEFCLLTGWTREELLGKRYIFEVSSKSGSASITPSTPKLTLHCVARSCLTPGLW